MSQVQVDFSKIAVQDCWAQARPRPAGPPSDSDFASLIDTGTDDPATPARADTPVGSRHGEGSSWRRADPKTAADRPSLAQSERANAASNDKVASSSSAADDAAGAATDDTIVAARGTTDGRSEDTSGADESDSADDRGAPFPPDAPDASDGTQPATLIPVGAVVPPSIPVALAAAEDPAGATGPAASEVPAIAVAQVDKPDAGIATTDDEPAVKAARVATMTGIAALAQPELEGEDTTTDGDVMAAQSSADDASPAATTMPLAERKGQRGKMEAEPARPNPVQGAANDDRQGEAPPQAELLTADPPVSTVSTPPTQHESSPAPTEPGAGKNQQKGNDDTPAVDAGRASLNASANPTGSTSTPPPTVQAQAAVGAIGTSAAVGSAAGPTASAPGGSDGPAAAAGLADVGVVIGSRAKAGGQSFEIRLDPPELGRIHVRLDVDRDGNVLPRLMVDRAETLDLLRRDAPQLERALQDAGLKADAQTMQFSLRQQNAGQQDQQQVPRSVTPPAEHEPGARAEDASLTYARLSIRTGGIDIRI